jgi:hypothetical protein
MARWLAADALESLPDDPILELDQKIRRNREEEEAKIKVTCAVVKESGRLNSSTAESGTSLRLINRLGTIV